MTLDCVDKLAYNIYTPIRHIGYLIIQYLMIHNEEIWKLLKYESSDALDQPNLTLEEKGALVFNGDGDSEEYRVFRSPFMDDAITARQTQLRVFLGLINPENRSVGTVDIHIECVTHNKLSNLNSYESRIEVMVQNLLETLNGVEVQGLGTLSFDKSKSFYSIGEMNMFNNRNFYGFTLTLSTKVGALRG